MLDVLGQSIRQGCNDCLGGSEHINIMLTEY